MEFGINYFHSMVIWLIGLKLILLFIDFLTIRNGFSWHVPGVRLKKRHEINEIAFGSGARRRYPDHNKKEGQATVQTAGFLSANKSRWNTNVRGSGARRCIWKLYCFSLSGWVALYSIRCSIWESSRFFSPSGKKAIYPKRAPSSGLHLSQKLPISRGWPQRNARFDMEEQVPCRIY